MKNTLFLFGINGIGKSTISRLICGAVSGSVAVESSAILRSVLGGVKRSELEHMCPERKRSLLHVELASALDRNRKASLIVCDIHLLVPIRTVDTVRYEYMWKNDFNRYALAKCLLTASTEDILARRQRDTETGVRARPAVAEDIERDARLNSVVFSLVFGGDKNAFKFRNEGEPHEVKNLLLDYASGFVL